MFLSKSMVMAKHSTWHQRDEVDSSLLVMSVHDRREQSRTSMPGPVRIAVRKKVNNQECERQSCYFLSIIYRFNMQKHRVLVRGIFILFCYTTVYIGPKLGPDHGGLGRQRIRIWFSRRMGLIEPMENITSFVNERF